MSEDVGYEGDKEELSVVVFYLANPEINYPLHPENLQMLRLKCMNKNEEA